MTDSPLNTSLSRSLGGKWIKAIPADEVQAAFGRLPSLQVLAAASILIDQLDVMDKSFFISLRGRAFSRSIKLILEYHNIRGHDLQELIRVLAHYHYVRGGSGWLDSLGHSLSGAWRVADYAAVSRVVRLS